MYAIVVAYLVWGMANNVVRYRRATSPSERRQVRPILLGLPALALLAVAVHLLWSDTDFNFFALRILIFLLGMVLAYAILGNRFIVFRNVGKQRFTYSIMMGLVFALYIITIKHIAEVLAAQVEMNGAVIETLLIILLAITFRPLIVRVQSMIGRSLSEHIFQYRQRFTQFTRDSFQITSMTALARTVNDLLRESLSTSSVDILLSEEGGGAFRSILNPLRVVDSALILPWLSSREHLVLDVNEVIQDAPLEQELFGGTPVNYIVPLLAHQGLTGLLLMGPSTSGRALTLDERDFLAIVANGVSMAVERIALLEKMRAEEVRVEKMEKLAFLGRLTAGIAHEFRNPLNIISTAAQTILRHPDDVALHRETGAYIVEETDRLSRTIEEFLQFAKPHTPTWEQANVCEIIDGAFEGLEGLARTNGVKIEKKIEPSLAEIVTSPGHVQRILYNLGLNAIEAMPGGGSLKVDARPRGQGAVAISVTDTGPGIPPEHHVRLFDPFFTTKPTGTGLGLAIVFMLVQSVKGKITFTSTPAGTRFVVELPINGSGT